MPISKQAVSRRSFLGMLSATAAAVGGSVSLLGSKTARAIRVVARPSAAQMQRLLAYYKTKPRWASWLVPELNVNDGWQRWMRTILNSTQL